MHFRSHDTLLVRAKEEFSTRKAVESSEKLAKFPRADAGERSPGRYGRKRRSHTDATAVKFNGAISCAARALSAGSNFGAMKSDARLDRRCAFLKS